MAGVTTTPAATIDDPPVLHRRDFVRGWEAGVQVIAVRREAGYQRHGHDFVEIVLVVAGTGRHDTVYGEAALAPGQVLVLYPGEWHGYRDCAGFSYYNLILGVEFIHESLSWTRDDPALSRLLWTGRAEARRGGALAAELDAKACARCRAWLNRIERLLREPYSAAHRCRMIAGVAEVLGEIAGVLPSDDGRLRPVHPGVVRAMRLLESRLSEAWDLSALAAAVGLNGSYLVRLFRAHTGLAPFSFLRKLRLERAAGLLIASERTILEVLLEVGFSDASHFTRAFRAHFGVSPREFRRR